MNTFDPATVPESYNDWWEDQNKYQHKEPGVIDDVFLTQLVFDQGPKDYGHILAKEEGIDFSEVTRLRISFKNILTIANLWDFTNLVKLQLDNNSISKIEGLDHMIHLKWLDLSFNAITKIENLNNLINLKDLALFHNQITTLENMDNLINLEIFSIGKNNLGNIDNVIYLRSFKSLKSVNFVDNPLTKDPEYRLLMVVYVPQLQYIDYSMVNNDQREKAKLKYENMFLTLEAKDEVMQSELINNEKRERKLTYYKKSFMECFAEDKFVEYLFQDDDEDSKLKLWWVIEKLFTNFRKEIQELTKELFHFGLSQHEERETELDSFRTCATETISRSTSSSIQIVDNFLEYKRERWTGLDTIEQEQYSIVRYDYREHLDALFNDLVREEVQLVEDLEDLISQLEINLNEMVASFKSQIHSKTSSIRELTNKFYEDLLQEANNLAEKKRKPDEFDEIPSEIMHLAGDKMLLTVTIQTCHDQRLAKIDYTQDSVYHRLSNYVPQIIEQIHEHMEIRRNRERIQEICHFVEFHENDGHMFELITDVYTGPLL